MTFNVGYPDFAAGVQLEVLAFNAALGAAPQTVQLDVSRWAYDIIVLSGPIAASPDAVLSAQWLDTAGVNASFVSMPLGQCPSNSASIMFYVQHLGPTVKYTITGYTVAFTFRVLHTNVPPPAAPLVTPNMAGQRIYSAAAVLGANTTNTQVMRGTGGALGGMPGAYVGPALMTVRGDQDGPGLVIVRDVNGVACGGLTIPQAAGVPALLSVPVIIPATQWDVFIQNGATAQTITTSIVATG